MAQDVEHEARRESASGFSLVELLVAIAIAGVLAALAMPVTGDVLIWSRADSSVEATVRAVATGRDRAIAERRNIELTFVLPNRLRLERQDVDGTGATVGKTTISEVILDNGQRLVKFPSVPDTPDLFGATSAVTFGGVAPYMFTSDGTLVDSAGDVVNGSIFLGTPDQPLTARAVTIFGVSGLTRAWKWRGGKWMK